MKNRIMIGDCGAWKHFQNAPEIIMTGPIYVCTTFKDILKKNLLSL